MTKKRPKKSNEEEILHEARAKYVRLAKGTQIELFRVIFVTGQPRGEATRVEIQGFHTDDPGEVGLVLAQTANILATAMSKLMDLPNRQGVLAYMVGSMIATLVQPLDDSIQEHTIEKAPFRGEPSKETH